MAYINAFSALGDPTRKAIFDRLQEGPACVTALAEGLPVSRPAVSQHLKVLKKAGLVADQVDGARRIYRVDWAGLTRLRDYLEGFWAAEMERQVQDRISG